MAWYDRNRRDLPWRRPERARDPYCVWVSEVMLQQTRVAAAVEYYERFLARFPNVRALAAAEEDQVLAAWSGLGYYRRARQLWRAAREVEARWLGRLPGELAALRRLPGIGRYTAGAILSIAFQQPAAAVDGNVRRIFARWLGEELPLARIEALGAGWGRKRPGDFNQALMDLGATVCLPRRPRCAGCPLHRNCRTRGESRPTRTAAARREITERYWLGRDHGRVALVRRPDSSALMAGMWELPRHRGGGTLSGRVRHSITIWKITAEVYEGGSCAPPDARWLGPRERERLPLTGLAKKILHRFADA